MAKKRELVLNDLARYEKASPRLVLEEYSSCEVPAGCGGGILRWIDPQEALPLSLRIWTAGETQLFLDGAAFRSSRVDARPGRHVLALHIVPKEGAHPVVALALRYSDEVDPKGTFEPRRSRTIGRKIEVLSGAGADLRGTSQKPQNDDWKEPGFDASGWSSLKRAPGSHKPDEKDWHFRYVQEAGAKAVELAGAEGPFWVRCSFEIPQGAAE